MEQTADHAKRPKIDSSTHQDILALTRMALTEDINSFDLEVARDCTTLSVVPNEVAASASFVAREPGVVCGVGLTEIIINEFASELKLETHIGDGQSVEKLQPIATLNGEARKILMMERTCLNFMCRLSGIATRAAQFARLVDGTKAKILDTRKTMPGWRRIEKHAVACGGGHNHRMGLYDAIMIKDNHLAMYGNHIDNHKLSVSQAVELARQWVDKNHATLPHGKQTIVQIEVDSLEQLKTALPASPDIVLLDNMNCQQLSEAVAIRNDLNEGVLLEASGGVNLKTVADIARTGVERISVGAITHSASNFDIGLDWTLES